MPGAWVVHTLWRRWRYRRRRDRREVNDLTSKSKIRSSRNPEPRFDRPSHRITVNGRVLPLATGLLPEDFPERLTRLKEASGLTWTAFA